ncbi:transcriptional regulator, partial [Haloarcula sp. Atlit-7R]
DGLAVEILRTVGETESGHMAYSALQSAFSQYDRTTVSRRLNEKLIEYGLCEKYGARGNLRIEILDKGALYLEELAKEKERQKALQDYVTNTPKPNHNTRVITDRPRGGREDDHRPTAEGEASTTPDGRVRLPRYHGVDYLSYAET